MSPRDEIEFESIQRIFAERDRKAAEAARNQRDHKARQPRYDINRESRYERTPRQDEYRPSRPKSSSGNSTRKTSSNRTNSTRRPNPNRTSNGGRNPNPVHTHSRDNHKINGKEQLVGFVAVIGTVLAIIGGVAHGGQSNPPEPPTGIISTASPSPETDNDNTSDSEIVIDDGSNIVIVETPQPTETPAVTEAGLGEKVNETVEHVSQRMIDALKGWESLHLKSYYCPGGKLTIGYGHTKGVKEGMKITEERAEQLLKEDLVEFEDYVKSYFDELDLKLCQADFDALTSFAFNLGPSTLWNSGILQMLSEGDREGAIDELLQYVNSNHKPLQGLIERRGIEAEWLSENLS